jgi:hypothetical protein
MLNTLRIAPLNIAPYASNRMGLLPYADYGSFMVSTQETLPAPKLRPSTQQLLPAMNANKLQADVFTSRMANTQQTAKNARVDATTPNPTLKQPALKPQRALNFMA